MAEQRRDELGDSAAVVAALERLEERLTRIEGVLSRFTSVAAQAAPLTAALVDSFDDAAQRLADRGIDVDARARGALSTLEGLTSPAMIAATHAFLEAERSPPPRVGLLGLLGAVRHPDVQRALGLALRIAERVGAALPQRGAPRLSARSNGDPAS
jgi:uncharacterized protein YjgD (DUF1641 family)